MLLRRHHITILLQAVLLLFALTSCVRDDFSSDTAGTDGTNSTPYYLNVHLEFNDNSSNGNRAAETNGDNLEYGEHNEHMIGEDGNLIILFRKDKAGNNKLFGVFALTSLSKHEHNTEEGRTDEQGGNNSNNNNSVNDNIEALHAYSTKFDAEEKSMFPTSCLVVLNCSKKMQEKLEEFNEKKNETTVDDILKVVWDKTDVTDENPMYIGYSGPDRKYFTMTNSIYFNSDGSKQADVAIPEGFIAKTLMAAKPVTVRVERMVAKFSFELPKKTNVFQPSEKADMIMFDGFNDDGSPKLKVKKWRIALTGWNMNALETKNYLFKNIENKPYFKGYSDENDWNHPANYRSHWSEDPHYDYQLNEDGGKNTNALVYPWQYRKAIDYNLDYYEDAISKGNGNITANDNLLRNYSFNDLELGRLAGGMLDIEKAFEEKIIYTPENTYDAEKVAGDNKKKHDSRDEMLACTHLLVGAEVQIDIDGESEDNISKYFIDYPNDDQTYRTPEHLFRDRNGFCYLSERECIASLVHDFNQLLESQNTMVFTHYKWTDGGTPQTLIADTNGDYKLYYKDGNAWKELTEEVILETGEKQVFSDKDLTMPIATLRRGDGKRLPWIKKLLDENRLAIGNSSSNPSSTIYTAETSDEAYGAYVPITKLGTTQDNNEYIKSLLYEWLGSIDHFYQGKMYYSHGVVDNPPIEKGKKLRYGVVRNNWYQFKLSDVKSLGTPVDDIYQPIVPERNGLFDQINFTIKIFGWHEVGTIIPSI